VGFLILILAVVLGAVIQGAIGFGLALVVVLVLTLVRPEVLPATVLLVMVIMADRARGVIGVTGLTCLLSGLLVGTLGVVALLLLVPTGYLSVLFGSLVLVAVRASSFSPKVALHNRMWVVGGVASAIMGTVAGIGGPPLALIYQTKLLRAADPSHPRSPCRSGRYSRLWLTSSLVGLALITSCSPWSCSQYSS